MGEPNGKVDAVLCDVLPRQLSDSCKQYKINFVVFNTYVGKGKTHFSPDEIRATSI